MCRDGFQYASWKSNLYLLGINKIVLNPASKENVLSGRAVSELFVTVFIY
jgi:hypothetical protein